MKHSDKIKLMRLLDHARITLNEMNIMCREMKGDYYDRSKREIARSSAFKEYSSLHGEICFFILGPAGKKCSRCKGSGIEPRSVI